MSDMKCPFCNEKLVRHFGMEKPELYCCDNPKCSRGGVATEQSWQELDRWKQSAEDHQQWLRTAEKRLETTRKALDLAIEGVEKMTWGCDTTDAERLLKQINKTKGGKDE